MINSASSESRTKVFNHIIHSYMNHSRLFLNTDGLGKKAHSLKFSSFSVLASLLLFHRIICNLVFEYISGFNLLF